jgi:regulator of sigma E protease
VSGSPGFLWTVMFFLIAIGPLIFVHELGHYMVGRWCGVKADVFAIGFGKEIFGWNDKRGTRWKLCLLPLGGYVRFAGDMNAASQPDDKWQQLPESERAQTFPAQPVWKRFLIVAAGPVTNFIAAVLIFMVITASVGELQSTNIIGGIQPNSAAAKAGFKVGDAVEAIDGRSITRFTDIGHYVELRPKQLMTFDVQRGGTAIKIVAAPNEEILKDRFGNVIKRGLMGLASGRAAWVKPPLIQLPGSAIRQTGDMLRSMVDGIVQIVTGRRSVKEMGGPIMIAKLSGQTATMGWVVFLGFMAMISINLGFINLLPIPMLDGGHLFFYTIEGIIRRPVSMQAQEWAFRSGFALLMALMLFVTFNDLSSFALFGRLAG